MFQDFLVTTETGIEDKCKVETAAINVNQSKVYLTSQCACLSYNHQERLDEEGKLESVAQPIETSCNVGNQ